MYDLISFTDANKFKNQLLVETINNFCKTQLVIIYLKDQYQALQV